jgi:hypothetical protein
VITRKALHERTAIVLKRIQASMDRRAVIHALLADLRAAVSEERKAMVVDLEAALVECYEVQDEAGELLEAG